MAQSALVPVLIALFVIVRFLIRELRERHLSTMQLFVLPAILWVVALALIGTVAVGFSASIPELVLASAIAIPVGMAIGFLVARFTTVRIAGDGKIFFRGSYVTVAIWIVALLLRLGARYLVSASHDRAATMSANAALIVLLAAALTAVRVLVRRKASQEERGASALTETAI